MPTTAPSSDPLGEIETLTHELASLNAVFSAKKVTAEEFESLSKQLKARISNAESRAYMMAKTDESIAKRLRAGSYIEPDVQQVCYHFITGSKKTLEPMFEADRIPRYFIEPEKGVKLPVDTALLRRLAGIGILNASLFEKIFLCPKCETPTNVYARLKCTQCESTDITIDRMIEHVACGTIHEERVLRIGNSMVCPSCKKTLQKPNEQRLIGLVCSCSKCGAHFEDPSQSFFCRKCEVDFNLTRAIISDIYTYNINEKTLAEIRSQVGLPAIAKVLQNDGFEVSMPGTISGGVGQFSMVARKQQKTIAIDVGSSEVEVDVEPVLELFVKLLEAKPDTAVFGAMPRLSGRARDVATMHGIKVAEGVTPGEVARKILEIASGNLPKTVQT
ncbi:MAG: hypothetical protein ABSE39_08740 [Candidatus Bathyarchaeia archaeon]|jgi:hypothetical protein